MSTRKFRLDGARITSFSAFIREINRAFAKTWGGEWSGNLDALNDHLAELDDEYVLVWGNAAVSRQHLGHEAMAEWLRSGLQTPHATWLDDINPNWRDDLRGRIERAERHEGPTLFDELVGLITADRSYMRFVLVEGPV